MNGNGVPLPGPQAFQQAFAAPLNFADEQARVFSSNIQNMFSSLNASATSALAAFQAPFTQRSPSLVQEVLTAPTKLAKQVTGVGPTVPTGPGVFGPNGVPFIGGPGGNLAGQAFAPGGAPDIPAFRSGNGVESGQLQTPQTPIDRKTVTQF